MSAAGGPDLITNGLVLCLDAANRKSYSGTGTVWRDLAGSNNGTLTNGPTFNSANGGALVFDGVDDCVKNTNNALADNLTAMTVSVWINASWSSITGRVTPIMTKIADASNGAGWELSINPNNNRQFGFYTQAAGGTIYKYKTTSGIFFTNNVWINLAASYSANYSDILLYINGTLQPMNDASSAGTISTISNTSSVTLASRDGANTFGVKYFACKIAQVQIYNRALTSAEVLQNYNATRSRFGV